MLRLPSFRFLRPRDLGEAVQMLSEEGPAAMLVAGGTDLWPKMKRRQFEPKVVIGLRQLAELRRWEGDAQRGLILGANWTLQELESHPLLQEKYPALAKAAYSISSPPLKTMGTLGGNLCVDTRCNYYDQTYEWRQAIHFCLKKDGDTCWVAPGSPRCWALSSTDLAPVMMAMGASVKLVSREGERMIPATALYQPDGIQYLSKRPDEILAEVHIPPVNGDITVFHKLRRRGSIDFPILNVAAWIRPDSSGRVCERARLVVGAVTSAPLLVEGAEALLAGTRLEEEVIEEVAQLAYRKARPMDNADLHFSWRHKMVPVWVRKALKEAASRLKS